MCKGQAALRCSIRLAADVSRDPSAPLLEAVMAREMREVLVCDTCGSENDVAAVAVTVDGVEQGGDFCAEHRQALKDAIAGILSKPPTSQPKGAGQQTGAASRRPAKRVASKRVGRAAPTKRLATCPQCGLEMSVQNLSRHIAARHPSTE